MSGNLHFQLKKISLNTVRYMLYNDDFDYVHPLNPGLGYGVLAVLGQPAERVFVWVVLIALLFAGINGVTIFMIGKGSMRAVRFHLTLAAISLVLTAAFLLAALSGQIRDAHTALRMHRVKNLAHYPRRDTFNLASSRWVRNAARHGEKLAEKRPQLLASV